MVFRVCSLTSKQSASALNRHQQYSGNSVFQLRVTGATLTRCFEKFWGKKSPKPRTGKPKNKQDLKEAKLRYIQQTPWASQVKRDVWGVRGEEERLLTVLYYDLISKRKRKRNGQGDDESD